MNNALMMSEFTGALIAAKTLFKELGPGKSIGVFINVIACQAKGEPWKDLGKPGDEKEMLSRRQIGSAVLLERALRPAVGPEKAREIVSEIVTAASVDFLGRNVPKLNRYMLEKFSEVERSRFLQSINEKFFNAEADMKLRGNERLDWTIKRCRFVELLDAIGERGMAPVFCEGDRVFFDTKQPDVRLERPETLAGGGECCDFKFYFKEFEKLNAE